MSLMRSLLRNAAKISNYNFKQHAQRRVVRGFRENQRNAPEEAAKNFAFGQEQLEVVKRYALISSLYPEIANVAALMKKRM